MPLAALEAEARHEVGQARAIHRAPVERHGQRHVLHHVQHRHQVVELVHQAHPADEVQKRRLARARRAHDGQKLALGHGERHVVQGARGRLALPVDLRQVADRQCVHVWSFPWCMPSAASLTCRHCLPLTPPLRFRNGGRPTRSPWERRPRSERRLPGCWQRAPCRPGRTRGPGRARARCRSRQPGARRCPHRRDGSARR